jgi:hypothetical protein|tara:strand:- start:80 stop:538 length:459 start_codon:yes stop_codon:yes gene_type:complete
MVDDDVKICEYLDTQYEVRVAKHYYVIVEKGANLNNVLEIESLYQDVQEVLGYKSWEANLGCSEWYDTRVATLNQHFYDFIEPYKVEMNMVDWDVVDVNGKKLDMYSMFIKLEKYYVVPDIITRMYEDWRLNKIIEFTEKRDDLFGNYEIIE